MERHAQPPAANTGAHPTAATVLVTAAEGCAQLKIGKSKWFAMVRSGELPKPLRIGAASRWRQGDIDAFVEKLAAAQVAA